MKIKEFGVESWINSYEKDCKYNLTNTCVGVLSTKKLLELSGEKENAIETFLNLELGYGRVLGSERLRNDIAGLYETAKDENIVITHGAVGANSLVMLSLVEKGDKVITYLPIYQQHYSIPESIGANVTQLFLKEENNWLPDLDELRKNATADTKLICLNNPNNPTGSIINEEYMNEIIKIAKNCGAYILCDEVYRGLSHNGKPFNKSIFDMYEKGISTGSMSKTFSLPGLRLGWIIGNKDFIKEVNVQRNYYVICVGRINDYLSCLAIENKDKIIQNNLEICRKNLEMLDSWVHIEPHITYVKPQGGTTAFLKYDIEMNSADLCLKLQKETGVMFLPGSAMDVEKHLRIGYTGDFKETQKALEIFSEWLNSNK
jgi:aspartate/methionine/tyrosine aminotransferase